MVAQGWALAYVQYSSAYVLTEKSSREEKRGLWQGAFIAPWAWRNRSKQTIVLGALKLPIDAQNILLNRTATITAPSAQCTIKGNVNRNGERIYHLESDQAYAKINMSRGQKRWFCTTDEAEAAGWRRAKR